MFNDEQKRIMFEAEFGTPPTDDELAMFGPPLELMNGIFAAMVYRRLVRLGFFRTAETMEAEMSPAWLAAIDTDDQVKPKYQWLRHEMPVTFSALARIHRMTLESVSAQVGEPEAANEVFS